MTDFPRSPAELTVDWLEQVLRPELTEGASITGFETADIGAGVGVLGVIARIALRYEGTSAGPASVVGKFASGGAEARELAETFDFYRTTGR